MEKVYPSILRIDITWEDILYGEIGQPQSCPIALALNRMFPDNWEVSVGGDNVRIDGINYTSKAAEEFVEKFDADGNASPMTIEVSRA